jgi:hypothetical protein
MCGVSHTAHTTPLSLTKVQMGHAQIAGTAHDFGRGGFGWVGLTAAADHLKIGNYYRKLDVNAPCLSVDWVGGT